MQVGEIWSEENPAIMLLNVVNAKAYNNLTASVTFTPTIGPWQSQLTAMLYKQWFSMSGYDGDVDLSKPLPSFMWLNNLSLPAGFLLGVNAQYVLSGHSQNTLTANHPFNFSLSLYKEFCQGRLNALLQAGDLFETNDQKTTIYSGLRTMTNYTSGRRDISLTLRYNFNVARSKYKGTGAGSSQKSRM